MTTATATKVTFGQALSSAFSAIFHVFTAAERAAITVEKGIGLAETEVDNLAELQGMRMDESKHLRAQQRAEYAKLLNSK